MRDRRDAKAADAPDALMLPGWVQMDPADRAVAERLLTPVRQTFRAGDAVQIEGDRAAVTYLVLSGWAALSKSLPDGERQILDLILPGDFFDPRAANQETTTIALEALTDAVIAEIPKALEQELGQALPDFEELKSNSMAGALTRMLERMLRLGKANAEGRIAHVLIELWTRLRAISPDHGRQLHLPLTQQKMGEFVGMTSVHVSRILSQLSDQGLIKTDTQMGIRILDLDALAELAGTDPETLQDEIIPQG